MIGNKSTIPTLSHWQYSAFADWLTSLVLMKYLKIGKTNKYINLIHIFCFNTKYL